jgi:hypothetical protein
MRSITSVLRLGDYRNFAGIKALATDYTDFTEEELSVANTASLNEFKCLGRMRRAQARLQKRRKSSSWTASVHEITPGMAAAL